ncbi:MAG: protease inhibitor I42 family protein [Halobacteriota archaeon]
MRKTVAASLIVVISLALAVGCAGCTSSTTPSPSPSTTTAAVSTAVASNASAALGGNTSNATALREATNLTVVQGQNFTIQLQSNPSTGYQWEPTYNNASITLVNQTYVASNISALGAPGTDLFTFLATQTGTSVITFNYVSPANQTTNSVNYTINSTTIVSYNVNGVLVSQGQDFTIPLPSNPSTGYHWELSLYDNSTLKFVNETFASNVSTSSTVVGAGGTDLFTFQATQTGTGGIILSEISPANQTTNAVVYSVLITS